MHDSTTSRPGPPDAGRLLAELDWMRDLARRLVAEADRDDLVQDVLTATLERPPRHARGLRGWLALALRNRARDLARGAGARRRREDEAARSADSAPAADDVEERARTQRRLVDEVLALEPEARRVVLLRYFDGLAPAEIATREGLNGSTVRSRLQRGLAALKVRLGGDERAPEWLPGLVLLASAPGGERAHDVRGGDPTSRPLTPSGAPRLAAAAAVIAAGGVALVALATRGAEDARPAQAILQAAAAAPAAAALEVSPRGRGRAEPAVDTNVPGPRAPGATGALADLTADEREAEDAPPAQTLALLEVRVTIDGEPATRGRVLARLPGGFLEGPSSAASEEVVVAPLGPGGVAILEVPFSSHGVVAVDLGGPVLLQRRARTTKEPRTVMTLKLGTATIEGTLLDASGAPVPDVAVQLGVRDGHDYGALAALGATDGRGRFTFQHLPAEMFSLYAASPDELAPERRAHGRLFEGERRSVLVGASESSVEVEGLLCDARGLPCTGAAPHAVGDLEFRITHADGMHAVATTVVDGDGRFSLSLPPGTYRVSARCASARNGVRLEAVAEVRPGGGTLELRLPGARVEGVVFRADVGGPHDPAHWGTLVVYLVDASGEVRARAGVDADGRFALDGVAPGAYSLVTPAAELTEPAVVAVEPDAAVLNCDLWVR